MVQLTITQYWFRKWLGAKVQAITWNNADRINQRINAVLGEGESKV